VRLPESDESLLIAIQQGNKKAFDELFARYSRPLRIRVNKFVQNADAAEDLLQEVFVRVWTKASTWNNTGPARAWLYRIASNLALNHLRAARRRSETSLNDAYTDDDDAEEEVYRQFESDVPGPETQYERTHVLNMVRELIQNLPDSKREVLQLVHSEDLSVNETAEALGIPDGTVKSRLHYGRRAIESRLRELFDQ
jgi:RNA polymerase sigma-70 factor, ECF subfamily